MNQNDIGNYKRRFFYIDLNTTMSPNDYLSSSQIVSALVHEYIHFLQDISTVYGLADIARTYAWVQDFYNIKSPCIKLPYRPENKTIIYNRDLFDFYYNELPQNISTTVSPWFTVSDIKEDSRYSLVDFPELKSYFVEISDGVDTTTYDFGAFAILESMAHLFEKHLYPTGYFTAKELPYDFVELVVEKGYGLKFSRSMLFALCDASLMYFNPAEVMKFMLEHIKQSGDVLSTAAEVYKYFENNITTLYGVAFKFSENWKRTLHEAKHVLKDVVNVTEYLFAANWILGMIDNYCCRRLQNPCFLSDILDEQNIEKARAMFFSLMQTGISPFVFNKKNEPSYIGRAIISSRDSEVLHYWHNFSEMYEYVFYSGKNCPYRWCTENCPVRSKPYKKGLGKPYCIFQQFSRVYGLYKRQII